MRLQSLSGSPYEVESVTSITQVSAISSLAGGLLIGIAAVLLLATTGRIAGVSGFLSRLAPPYADGDFLVRLAFVLGIVAAPQLYILSTKGEIPSVVTTDVTLLVVAGLLVGFGSVLGSGCTSGHGVCGLARFSSRSIAATAVFMAAAVLTVFAMRHMLGG